MGRVMIAAMCVAAAGCVGTPVRPATPARDLDRAALAAMKEWPDEHHYVLIFGGQATPRTFKGTHSWATLVRTRERPGAAPEVLDVQTISWLPKTLAIRPLGLRVEPGANLELRATIADVLRHREEISVWGPYEVRPGAAFRFVTQKAFLDSGVIGYQCADCFGEAAKTGKGCNCFHAISDMDPDFDRRRYPDYLYGEQASENMVRQLFQRPVMIDPQRDHEWVFAALRLEGQPMERRRYTGPMAEQYRNNLSAAR